MSPIVSLLKALALADSAILEGSGNFQKYIA